MSKESFKINIFDFLGLKTIMGVLTKRNEKYYIKLFTSPLFSEKSMYLDYEFQKSPLSPCCDELLKGQFIHINTDF